MCFPADVTADEMGEQAAIRQTARNYTAALRRGDGQRAAALWTSSGELIDARGRVSKGQELAGQVRPTSNDPSDAAGPEISVGTLRFITPEVAIEDGTIQVGSSDDRDLAIARFVAIWVKRDGRWLLDGVREFAPHEPANGDRLRQLGWLLGDWAQEGSMEQIEATCRWSPDGNFLLREIRHDSPDGHKLTISQRIGWNPTTRQITSWNFDSEGGIGTGLWTRRGEIWAVESRGVLADGQSTSSSITYTRRGEDAMTLESTNSSVGDVKVPDLKIQLGKKSSSKRQ
jgi:uncharacterized protein (TIGR02246 family)